LTGSHAVRESERDGLPVRELVSPEGLVAGYVPRAGMVCASLRSRGAELLGQRKGVVRYAETGSTMGIPLLHPWANRLCRTGYGLGDTEVEVPLDSPFVHDDGQGLPIHGLVGGIDAWRVEEFSADADAARLAARLDFAARDDLMALFPFAHELLVEVALRGSELAVRTILRATGDRPVPVAFGYHPYFQLPDLPRSAWEVTLPVRRRARLDARCLPTGETEPARVESGPLGDTVYDDLFPELEPEPVFVLAGGGRRVEVAFGKAYPVGVVYAPANDDVVCFEPMTAPTNPFEGGTELRWVEPGASFAANFSVTVG
jgi:aldose 1-epimerase